jgi:hypothetical protein
MGYQQKFYSFGTKPYVYNWTGSAMRPSMTHNQGLGADKVATVDPRLLMQAKVKDSGTTSSTDPRFTAIVMGAQQRLNKLGAALAENGLLSSKMVAALQASVPVDIATMTWAQAYASLDAKVAAAPTTPAAPSSGIPHSPLFYAAVLAVGYLFWKK